MDKIRRLFKSLVNINIASYTKGQQILLFCCLCFFFLILNIASLFLPLRESLTYDEASKFESGIAILSGRPSERGAIKVNKRNIVPVSALNVLISKPISQQIISELTDDDDKKPIIYDGRIYPNGRIYFGKLATIFASLILAIYIFCWSRQLYGVNAGFLALSLYILDPNIIAHSRLVTQDIFSACSIFIATYYFWRFLKFGGWKNAVLSMITFGIAQVTRYTSIYLLPIYFVLTICFYSSSILNLIKTRNFKKILLNIKNFSYYTILLLLTTIIIINLSFSFEKTFTKLGDYKFESRSFSSWQSSSPLLTALPIPVPYAYLRGIDFGKYKQETGFGSGPSYLMGRLGIDDNGLKGFKEYYIVAFIYKVPIA
ncbi:MAG: glycosyltransferase family 39 protein, partial [Xenococcaceae cyanobacterium MO_167.B52]|nr:glycosyltransferase family 39 protein [Xenococcaceae cyanobacterium MO_167.B52]